MRTNVSELLRNFPKIRRAALAGERVVVSTRDGNLVITAEPAAPKLFGALSEKIRSNRLKASDTGAAPDDWKPKL